MADKKPNLVLQARARAVTMLIQSHPSEFDTLMERECEKLGTTYVAPESREDKAKAKARKALADAGLPIPEELRDDLDGLEVFANAGTAEAASSVS